MLHGTLVSRRQRILRNFEREEVREKESNMNSQVTELENTDSQKKRSPTTC